MHDVDSVRGRTLLLALVIGVGAQVLGLCDRASAGGESAVPRSTNDTAVHALETAFPGIVVNRDRFGRAILTGTPMGTAHGPDRALDLWLESHAAALAIHPDSLELLYVSDLSGGRATVFAYRPAMNLTDGRVAEIEGGAVRFIVRRIDEPSGEEATYSVTYAAAHTALVPDAGFPAVTIPAAQAETIARLALGSVLDSMTLGSVTFGSARLVIVPSATSRADSVLAWHVSAESEFSANGESVDPGSVTVRIDPATGAVLEIRDERLHVDVSGSVEALVSPAPLPDLQTNPPVAVPLSRVQVSLAGGATVLTESDGTFTLPNGASAPVSVEVALIGEWVSVEDLTGAPFSFSMPVTPPGGGTLLLDAQGDELLQAQLNGYHFTTRAHDFVRTYTVAGIPDIDVAIPCRVNLNDTCNANYDPNSERINFFLSGDGCENSAFSSVISHEYGHFVVDQLNLSQGAFGEGFGDVLAMFIDNDPLIGREFEGPGTVVRDPVLANIQYPCSGGVHLCGQILGAVWWKIREQFAFSSGDAAGLEEARQLFVDWSLITLGGAGGSSAHPQTALEVLAVDDDDSTLQNGTPRFPQICAAFAEHSIDCPPFPPVIFSYPLGLPTQITPGVATALRVLITDGTETHLSTTVLLHLRSVGSPSFVEVPGSSLGGGEFEFEIPEQTCGGAIEFSISVETLEGSTHSSPVAGEFEPFSVAVFDEVTTILTDDFETDSGWTVGSTTDNATTGVWERVVPVGTGAAPGADHSEPGTTCFVTGQGLVNGSLGANDVDNGSTTLVSPLLNLTGGDSYEISYWRWYSNEIGAAPNSDVLIVEISGDDGTSWVLVETVGPTGIESSGGWFEHRFDVATFVAPTATTRVRFVASDVGDPSLVEAAMDDFVVVRRECSPSGFPDPPEFRRGDTTGNFELNIGDVVLVLAYMFTTGSISCIDAADMNDSGDLNLVDAMALLQYLYSTGNPLPPPFLGCGPDPTEDTLDCAIEPSCP